MDSNHSTDFEESHSIDSVVASSSCKEQEYDDDDDDFDNYSNSFRTDVDASVLDAPLAAARLTLMPQLLHVSTLVQVFWEEENKWFDGVIQSVNAINEPHYYVHYEDGEQQWESTKNLRPAPTLASRATQYTQLQQLVPLSARDALALVDCRVTVYWANEGKWYSGIVSAANASPAAVKIEYDDGDSRWDQECMFHLILLLNEMTKPQRSVNFKLASAQASPTQPSFCERVLYARPYKQAVSDHFQSVRIARPYRCVIDKHSKSVITPRPYYGEQSYLHADFDGHRPMADCSRGQ